MSEYDPPMVTHAGADPAERNIRDAEAIARLVGDLRSMLRDAPDDPEVAAILADCDTAEHVARTLLTTPAIALPIVLPSNGIRAA